jgi:4-hydroxybenzoyl-CoA thioesterase/acyl-CoA thioester hydrolase
MPTPFHTTRFVEFSDTDMAGIVHFSAFFRYMESAEHSLLRSLGFSVFSKVDDEIITFPRVEVSCEYRSPARCEEILDIAVTVRRVGTKSVSYGFAFSHDGRDLAVGEITCVCCRVPQGCAPISIPIPESMAEKLRKLAAD